MNSWRNAFGGAVHVFCFVALLWVIELFNILLDRELTQFGLQPGSTGNQVVVSLLLWSFLHVNTEHLMANTVPVLLLGWFVALRGTLFFFRTLLLISLVAGAGVWLFGRDSHHLGASVLIFGFFGFLVVRGLMERGWSAFMIALTTFFYFGGMLMGVLPGEEHVSWEAHLFGLITGVFIACQLPVPDLKPSSQEVTEDRR